MQIIKKLCKMIDEELNDAEKYANCALNHKDSDHELADVFYSLSGEEMEHMEQLHTQVVRLIKQRKAEKGDIPPVMQELYNYLHEQQIEHAAEVNVLRSMYRG